MLPLRALFPPFNPSRPPVATRSVIYHFIRFGIARFNLKQCFSMDRLSSVRLELLPLDLPRLQLFRRNEKELLRALQLRPLPVEVRPRKFVLGFQEALHRRIIPRVRRFPDAYRWFTHWLIIHRGDRRSIGGIGLSGRPNAAGETRVGYFIDHRYEGRGYASEALQCLLEWAFTSPDLCAVIATTPAGHAASQRVLLKNGFREAGEAEPGILRWRRPALSPQ